MTKLLPFFNRYGLLIIPLTVIGLAIDAQIFIYQRFSEFHISDSWIFHLLYLAFGPFMFFYKSERGSIGHSFIVWKRLYWALFLALAMFYVFVFIGAALI
jgi:hypothetical protein